MKTRYLTAILFALTIIFGFEGLVLGCNCSWWTRPDLCHECVDFVWVDTCVGCESCNEHGGLYGSCEDDDNNCGGSTPYCVDTDCVQCRGVPYNDCTDCKDCVDGTCQGSICSQDECCINNSCEILDEDWSPTVGFSVECDPVILNNLNSAISQIPGVNVSFDSVEISISARRKECCPEDGQQIQYEICGEDNITIQASFDKIVIYGGSFEKEVDFGLWGASIKLTAEVYISGGITAGVTIGSYINECSDLSCLYGSGSIGGTIAANGELTACCCLKIWGTDHCSPEIGVTGSASISFSGSVRNNQCGACDGLHGEISLLDIILSGSVNIGVYSGNITYQIYP